MAEQRPRPVVAGVDGTDQSRQALRYAIREAKEAGCGLRLVHAIHETAPLTPMMPFLSMETFAEIGRRIADDAATFAHDLDPTVEVETAVLPGAPAAALSRASDRARLVVLGHRDRSLLGRVLTSSTTTGVAARAHCPVVSVPSAWVEGRPHGRIVVGVDGSGPSQDALATAYALAARRGARLTVLHAWKLPNAYDDVILSRIELQDWEAPATEQLERMVAPLRAEFPAVEVELDLRHQYPAPALVGATEGADLVVVGRRGHGAPLGVYLGSLARTLIREARCPVEVTPHHAAAELPEQRAASEEVSPQA